MIHWVILKQYASMHVVKQCSKIYRFIKPKGGWKKSKHLRQRAIAGVFLTPLTAALSFANKKNRFLQINRLACLFKDTSQIVQVCCQFLRKITLAKEKEVQGLMEVQYEGWRKVMGLLTGIREVLEQQWKDLATADTTELTITPEDKLAIGMRLSCCSK